MKKKQHIKEIHYNDLPLELKKQFLHHLAKNNVDFEQLKDSKYMQAKVKIVEQKDGSPHIIPPPGERPKSTLHMKTRPGKIDHHFHDKCIPEHDRERIKNTQKLARQMK